MKNFLAFLTFAFVFAFVSVFGCNVLAAEKKIETKVVVDDLNSPWAVVASPDGEIWITETEGKIRVFNMEFKEIFYLTGFPDLVQVGQGGLLDIAFHPDFKNNGWIYAAYTVGDSKWNTRIVRFKFDRSKKTLTNPLKIYDGPQGEDGAHFGCRMVFDKEGFLFASFGERHHPEKAQDVNEKNGKIVRLKDDGSIPADNPFGATNPVYSYGHRNPQGLDIDPATGFLYDSEHGPSGYDGEGGGDEINWIRAGLNYGWPVISHSEKKAGMESPLVQYTPAIAPSGIAFYKGDLIPQWKGSLFVANLRGERLLRISLSNKAEILSQEELLKSDYGRLRDVGNAPDGSLLVISDAGELIRLW